jgi:hypothetical protein
MKGAHGAIANCCRGIDRNFLGGYDGVYSGILIPNIYKANANSEYKTEKTLKIFGVMYGIYSKKPENSR